LYKPIWFGKVRLLSDYGVEICVNEVNKVFILQFL